MGRRDGRRGALLRPDGTLIGRLDVPEAVSNISFGGAKRNRPLITAETSLYSLVMGVTGTHPTGPGRRRRLDG